MQPDLFSKIPSRWLIKSLNSHVCPSCAGWKCIGMSLCRPCWIRLDRDKSKDLYRLVGRGYEEAFAAAMHALMVTTVHLPGGIQRISPGAYVDRDGTLHIEVEEMLAVLNVADTPENRDQAARAVVDMVSMISPGTKITEV